MRTFFKSVGLSSKIVFILIFSIFTAASYVLVAYLVAGHEIISSGAFGSDAWTFISRMKLLSEYFPNYPFWNPKEGAGVSLTYSYPILIHTIIIATSKLVGWSLVEAFKFWEFAYVPIFAFGVFIYAWVRLRIKIVAFLAGLFFVISPIAWMWPFEWGFIAEAISAMFFPYTFLFFDLFLLRVLDRDWSFKTRLFLVLTVILLGLSVMAHPFVFTGTLALGIVYGLLLAISRQKDRIKSIFAILGSVVAVVALTTLLFGFWLIPYYNYTGLAVSSSTSAGGAKPKLTEDWDKIALTFTHFFSIDPPEAINKDIYFSQNQELKEGDFLDGQIVLEKGYIWRNLSFPLAISILYFLGIVTSFIFWRRKIPHLFLASLILVLISVNTRVLFSFVWTGFYASKLPIIGVPLASFIGWFASWRGDIFAARLIVPIAAAFGAYGLFALFLYPFKFLDKYLVLRWSKNLTLSVLALLLAFGVLFHFHNKPVLPFTYLAYGKEVSFLTRAIYLRNFWGEMRPEELSLRNKAKDKTCKDTCQNSIFDELIGLLNRSDDLCRDHANTYKTICQNEKFNRYFDASRVLVSCIHLNYISICDKSFSDEDVTSWVKLCEQGNDPFPSNGLCRSRSDLWKVLVSDLSPENIERKLKQFPQKEFYLGEGYDDLLSLIPDDAFLRYDLSPNFVGLVQRGPYLKKTPQLSMYAATSSLIERLWGYQLSSFYVSDPVYSDRNAIPEIAQYLGIKYVITSGGGEMVEEKLQNGGFLKKLGDQPIYEFEEGEPLVTVSSKPSILVVGSDALRAYEIVFKRAPYGLVSYNKALLVKGKEHLDDYSLEELRDFEMLYLYGYKYKNRRKGWRLLEQYVKGGGRLFIDTGWQFNSADWEAGETADFFPTTSLSWTNFGKTSDYRLHGGLIKTEGIETSGFEPLIWNDQPWSVSSGDTLRPWAQPILTVKGHPLIAGGTYGQGRVVWSGMNLLGHMGEEFKTTNAETIFASRLIDWLLEGFPSRNYVFRQDFDAMRPHPDRVEFSFNTPILEPVSLYFKEAAHPYWKAELERGGRLSNLDIYKAGPGYIFLKIPEVQAGDRVNLFIKRPLKDSVIKVASIITLLALITYLVYPKPFHINIPKKLKTLISKEKLSILSSEEENY